MGERGSIYPGNCQVEFPNKRLAIPPHLPFKRIMENIDELMRQKFDSEDPGERFEFQEEYWEQAQVLLEQEDARRRRRRWGMILALLLLAGLLFWLFFSFGDSEGLANGKAEPGSNAPTAITETQAVSSTVQNSINTPPDPSNSTPINLERGSIMEEKANEEPANSVAGPKKEIQPLAEGKKSLKTMPKGERGQKTAGTVKSSSSAVARDAEALRSPENQQLTVTNPAGVSNLSASTQDLAKPNPTLGVDSMTQSPKLPIPIYRIQLPLRPLDIPVRVIPILRGAVEPPGPIAQQKKPEKAPRFTLGLSLAGAANRPDTSGRWAGWALGAYGDYRLNQRWSLRLGAQWRFVPGYAAGSDSLNPEKVEQLRYSFGYQREVWERDTRGLHYLEVPLSASWQKARFGLEAGAAAGMLLAVQNTVTRSTESSLEPSKTEEQKFVKGDASAYQQVYFAGFVGAEFRLNKRIALMTRGQYRISPIFNTSDANLKNRGLGSVDLGLRVRLF